MAMEYTDKTGGAKGKVRQIKEGTGKGPGMGSGGEVDPTSTPPSNTPATPWDWNTDGQLKPNTPGPGTKSF
jgi:hypothetical protein